MSQRRGGWWGGGERIVLNHYYLFCIPAAILKLICGVKNKKNQISRKSALVLVTNIFSSSCILFNQKFV
jgi:hypothetical protein